MADSEYVGSPARNGTHLPSWTVSGGVDGVVKKNVAVLTAYFLAGQIGLAVPFTSGNVSPVWPPAGVAVAALLLFGPRVWPGIAAGAFLVNFFSPIPHIAALGLSVGNTLGPVLATFLLRKRRFDARLQRLRDLVALIWAAVLIGTAVSATVGVSVLYATRVNAWSGIRDAWLVWWLGDGMGVLLVTPLLLTIPQLIKAGNKDRTTELLSLIILAVCTSVLLFDNRLGVGEDLLAFAVFPIVIWAAIRFEVAGAAAVSCVVASAAIWETALGIGPFVRESTPVHNAAVLQAFLGVISVSGLLLSAAMAEKRQVQEALHLQTQKTLASTSQRLELAQQAANIGAWEWNIRTGAISWSHELELIHGFPPDGFDGKYETWLSTVHPEDNDWVQREIRIAIERNRPFDLEYRSIRPDGSVYWTASRGSVLFDENSNPERMVGICMDINSRKLAEHAMRNSEKLAATGRLAATMAHEINNPLAAVMNLVFLAKQDSSLSAQARNYLNLADQELQQVTHITNRALGFYRDSSSPVMLDMPQILDEVLVMFQKKMEVKHIQVIKKYRGYATVLCNKGEVRQMLSNLISNAIDAILDGGALHVRVSEATGWGNKGLNGVCICIADTGCGMRRTDQSRIFEPFFTTKKDVGTGLGLWIAHGIIQNHGGAIRFRSSTEQGRNGTAFWVFLPRPAEASAVTAS